MPHTASAAASWASSWPPSSPQVRPWPPTRRPPRRPHGPQSTPFKALGLTAEQKAKVEQITGTAAAKIHAWKPRSPPSAPRNTKDLLPS